MGTPFVAQRDALPLKALAGVALVVVLLAGVVQAELVDGNELLRIFGLVQLDKTQGVPGGRTSKEDLEAGRCLGIIHGVLETFSLYKQTAQFGPDTAADIVLDLFGFCPPSTVPLSQEIRVTLLLDSGVL
jgi:hypothetical protein